LRQKLAKEKQNMTRKVLFGLLAAFFALVLQLQAQPQRVDEREVRNILNQINVKLDDLKYNIDSETRRRRISRSDEDALLTSFNDLQRQLNDFSDKLYKRRDSQYDVSNLLNSAKNFDENLMRIRPSFAIQRDWDSTKDLFSRLANIYGVQWDWKREQSTLRYNSSLTGTYSLDNSRSDDVRQIAERAVSNSNVQDREAAKRDIETLLEPPQNIAIQLGRSARVTLESSLAPQISITADGIERTETLPDGRMARIRATLRGQQELVITNIGDDNDYRVTFLITDGGRTLRVTRTATVNYLGQTLTADSYYTKTDSVARFGIYNSSDQSSTSGNQNKRFIVPNGIILTGTLENDISTKNSKNYDRFTMTVVSPTEFRGAVIQGYLSGVSRSGRVSGRPQITFNFETIRMPNGETYDFRGVVMAVTDTEGKTIRIDNEGAVKGDSQTKETVKRGAIGSAVGALIGAIAGGAKGAAIGAIIGGSAGAGSVVVQGKDDLDLKAGSSIMVQATTPSSQR